MSGRVEQQRTGKARAAPHDGDGFWRDQSLNTWDLRAEAPGDVRILVRRADVDLAKARLIEYRKGFAAIDWSTVDVGEPEE